MYRIVLDTNVMLDYLLGREPGCGDCVRIIEHSLPDNHVLYVPALSLKDLYYTLARFLKQAERNEHAEISEDAACAINEIAWTCTRKILDFAQVIPIGAAECLRAFTFRPLHNDFEDDIIIASAQSAHADFLVSNDEKLRQHAPIACLSSTDMVALLESGA